VKIMQKGDGVHASISSFLMDLNQVVKSRSCHSIPLSFGATQLTFKQTAPTTGEGNRILDAMIKADMEEHGFAPVAPGKGSFGAQLLTGPKETS